MVGLANLSLALAILLSYRCVGEADYDSMKAKRLKRSTSRQRRARMGDLPDSEEDLGHSMNMYVFPLPVQTHQLRFKLGHS